jgi:hypothetical protein
MRYGNILGDHEGGKGWWVESVNLHFFPSTCPRLRLGSIMSLTRRFSSFVSRYRS